MGLLDDLFAKDALGYPRYTLGGLLQPQNKLSEEQVAGLLYQANQAQNQAGSNLSNFALDMAPGVGDVRALNRAQQQFGQGWNNLKQGQYLNGAGNYASGLTEALTAIPGIGDIALAAKGAGTMAMPLITAFHGSPHKFDAFDMSKIGTGEGAQAYGHGLYFAEDKNIAKVYHKKLSPNSGRAFKVDAVFDTDGNEVDRLALLDLFEKNKHTSKNISNSWATLKLHMNLYPGIQAYESSILRGAKELGLNVSKKTIKPGSIYKVDIPDEAISKMLDWDKPLSEQPESVRKALDSLVESRSAGDLFRPGSGFPKRVPGDMKGTEMTGRDAYQLITNALGHDSKASQKLNELGIPGIKYFDGSSRTAGEGTRNFVVFDDKIPKIIKRE